MIPFIVVFPMQLIPLVNKKKANGVNPQHNKMHI